MKENKGDRVKHGNNPLTSSSYCPRITKARKFSFTFNPTVRCPFHFIWISIQGREKKNPARLETICSFGDSRNGSDGFITKQKIISTTKKVHLIPFCAWLISINHKSFTECRESQIFFITFFHSTAWKLGARELWQPRTFYFIFLFFLRIFRELTSLQIGKQWFRGNGNLRDEVLPEVERSAWMGLT